MRVCHWNELKRLMMMHHREKNVLAFAKSLGVFLTNQELRLIVCYQERFRMPLSTWFRECSLELAEGDSSPSAIFPENWPLTYPFASHCTCSFTQHIWSCGGCSVCRPSILATFLNLKARREWTEDRNVPTPLFSLPSVIALPASFSLS